MCFNVSVLLVEAQFQSSKISQLAQAKTPGGVSTLLKLRPRCTFHTLGAGWKQGGRLKRAGPAVSCGCGQEAEWIKFLKL